MPQDWQKLLPEAQDSVRVHTNERVLWRSASFNTRGRGPYQIAAIARWDDRCGNGSNTFHMNIAVVMPNTTRESEYTGLDDVPDEIRALIPPHLIAAQKFNGCHPFGPWYYIENTVFLAGDRDHWGLRKGEKKQVMKGGKVPSWILTRVYEGGQTSDDFPQYADGPERPTQTCRLEYRPWYREGEGKARELNSARHVAVWPEATDEQLMSDNLAQMLRDRLPALIVEFRKTIESLEFTW